MTVHTLTRPTDSSALDDPFGADSVIRRVAEEALVLLSGGRSVLLQLAHPLIAEGVSKYSNFASDPLARLFRTMLFMDAGLLDKRRRPEALRRFHKMHGQIRGRLSASAGAYEAGTPYAGSDPELKRWVHATFVDSCLKTYERFVRPLTDQERRRYFDDSVAFARLLQIPPELLLNTPEAFERYMIEMLEGDLLAVTDTTRGLARSVLHPDVGLLPSASAALLRFVTAGMLPDRFRVAFGLEWSDARQRMLDRMSRGTRFMRPYAPAWVWQSPLLEGRLARVLLPPPPTVR